MMMLRKEALLLSLAATASVLWFGVESVAESCTVSFGYSGTCMNTAQCSAKGGGSVSGYCPGPADFQCCIFVPCTANDRPGMCQSAKVPGQCSGTLHSGACRGPDYFKCCLPPAPSTAKPTVATPKPTVAPEGDAASWARKAAKGEKMDVWGGGIIPYSWMGGHGASPGPTLGCCNNCGYSGPTPCEADRTVGFDCSGFARWIYSLTYGSDVLGGGSTKTQIKKVKAVTAKQEKEGDLVFFGENEASVFHVGIYVGNNKMISAPRTGRNVSEEKIWDGALGFYRYEPSN